MSETHFRVPTTERHRNSLNRLVSLNRPSIFPFESSLQTLANSLNTTIRLSKTTLRSAGLYCIFPLPSAALPCDSLGSTPSLLLSPSHSLALNHSVPRVQPHSPLSQLTPRHPFPNPSSPSEIPLALNQRHTPQFLDKLTLHPTFANRCAPLAFAQKTRNRKAEFPHYRIAKTRG